MTPRGVVGAAIVVDGRLLAARRTEPAALAGGWEVPGGKVDPGERPEEALTREIREELGCEIEIERPLRGRSRLTPSLQLDVYLCRLVDGEPDPAPLEHDRLRWLAPEELDEVRWLPADEPFLPELRQILIDGQQLPGGNVGGAVRIGETVRRPTGAWTTAVHGVLEFLADRGLEHVPRVLGHDERDREVLTYLPGEVVYMPEQRLSDAQLASLMRWLRRYHDTVADYRPTGARPWRFGTRALGADELITHNDIGWYNLSFTGAHLTGVFDWDLVGPGTRLDDLAFAAWNDVPLVRWVDDTPRRLQVMADAYGGVDPVAILRHVRTRIRMSGARIAQGCRAGDPGMIRLVSTGVLDKIESGLARLEARQAEVEDALRRESRR